MAERLERSEESIRVSDLAAPRVAEHAIEAAGFTIIGTNRRIRGTGVSVSFEATDQAGATWWFDVAGPNVTYRGGMTRNDVVWRALGRAAAIASKATPLVVLTTKLPKINSVLYRFKNYSTSPASTRNEKVWNLTSPRTLISLTKSCYSESTNGKGVKKPKFG